MTEKEELKELKKSIKNTLLKYFEYHDNGGKSKKYCSYFSAQDAIDEIHDAIGSI